jgi:ABC-type polysaccharide/polyol phosphate export permease
MVTYLSRLWDIRHFWISLVRMDLRTRYRRSALGLGWSLLQPVTMTAVLYVVFAHFVKLDAREYVPHLLTGLVCWNFLLACSLQGCQSFFLGEQYIRQCPLPLAVYPLRTAIGAMFHLCMGVIVLIAITAMLRGPASLLGYASLAPSLGLLFVFGWSMAVLAGTANVFFQDTQHLAEVGFQILFYLTPIIYRLEDLAGHQLGWLLQLNPVVPFLELVRSPLLHGAPPPVSVALTACGLTALAASIAALILRKMQDKLVFYL